jgi:hypothetical protein
LLLLCDRHVQGFILHSSFSGEMIAHKVDTTWSLIQTDKIYPVNDTDEIRGQNDEPMLLTPPGVGNKRCRA